MERRVAINKLNKLLGKGASYRIDNKAPQEHHRKAAQAVLPGEVKLRREISEAMDARRKALCDADTEYQNLKAAYEIARKRTDVLQGLAGRFKITVGKSNGMFFVVEAQGDSWEDVIAQIKAKGGK